MKIENLDMEREEFKSHLQSAILPFWLDRMRDPAGGWWGRMDGNGMLHPDSPRGCILNARILWTLSSAYRVCGKEECLSAAAQAYRYVSEHFMDRQYGGCLWSVDAAGRPLDTKKQFYAIAFVIYALAEYYRATGEKSALQEAVELFRCIRDHSFDPTLGGYLEACTRSWQPIEDMRLSDKDRNDAKTMNTHLHILEGFTGLYRVWKDESLREALADLVNVFLERIVQPDGHLGLFFDENWVLQGHMVSYGHDIEASWLLDEAAAVLGDEALAARVREVTRRIADASLEGLQPDGSLIYEFDPQTGVKDSQRHWWVQAESLVGCVNRWQDTGDAQWLERAAHSWDFIKKHIVCPDGEWYWGALEDGRGGFVPNTQDDRAGFWKCPYHNGRMCMEMIERLQY